MLAVWYLRIARVHALRREAQEEIAGPPQPGLRQHRQHHFVRGARIRGGFQNHQHPGVEVPGDLLAGRHDEAHVRVFGLAQRRGHADVDGVEFENRAKSPWWRAVCRTPPAEPEWSWECPRHRNRPAFTRRVFSLLMSMPVTENPALANSTASGRPTYPRPTIPTRARRVRIFSSRILAVACVVNGSSGMEESFSHAGQGGAPLRWFWSVQDDRRFRQIHRATQRLSVGPQAPRHSHPCEPDSIYR